MSGPPELRILYLAANPLATDRLRLDHELRAISERLDDSSIPKSMVLLSRWAVRIDDLREALLEIEPHVIHFSGHGTREEELVLEGHDGQAQNVDHRALAKLIGLASPGTRVVVFNACYSAVLAQRLLDYVDCAIGMRRAIGDRAAIAFSASFYQAIGYGRSLQSAFDLAVNALDIERIPESHTPQLVTRDGITASAVVLLSESARDGGAPATEDEHPPAAADDHAPADADDHAPTATDDHAATAAQSERLQQARALMGLGKNRDAEQDLERLIGELHSDGVTPMSARARLGAEAQYLLARIRVSRMVFPEQPTTIEAATAAVQEVQSSSFDAMMIYGKVLRWWDPEFNQCALTATAHAAERASRWLFTMKERGAPEPAAHDGEENEEEKERRLRWSRVLKEALQLAQVMLSTAEQQYQNALDSPTPRTARCRQEAAAGKDRVTAMLKQAAPGDSNG